MPIDLAPDVLAALRSAEGRALLAEAVRGVVRDEIRAAISEQQETLKPLAQVLGLKNDSARKRVRRDPGLRALGVPVGRRILFRAHEVEAYLRASLRPEG